MPRPDQAPPDGRRAVGGPIERLVQRWAGRFLSREVLTFLAVGGTGYVVDVVAFNLLRSMQDAHLAQPALAGPTS